jgi:ubiquinone biosynthesis protein UbiJ
MHQQDNLIDNVRIGIEGDTTLVSETIHLLETTLEKNNQETAGEIKATGERVQALEQTWNDRIKNLTSLQERNRAAHLEEIKSLREAHATDMEEVGNRVGYVESQLEGHAVAISHVDQKMTNFTTKDFYERVIQELMKINPMIFSQTHQLSSVCNEVKTMKDALRNLGERLKQLTEQRNINANLSPHSVLDAASAQDGPSNGALKSDSSEGPSPSLTSAIADIDTLRTRIDGVEKGLADHITAYLKRINDIKDWTVSASERLALHTESAAAISEDIKALREYLASLGSLSGSPVQIPNADRWRAVASYQDQMQGITSSSNENGNTVGNGNGNGNF